MKWIAPSSGASMYEAKKRPSQPCFFHPSVRGVVVTVRNGVVWLNGVVPSWEGNDARLHATRSIAGVRSIVNELQVGQEVR